MTYKIKQMTDRTTKGVSNAETHVHDYVILQTMATGRVSPAEIAEGVQLTGRYTTKDPVIKSVNWHLNKLVKEGVVMAIYPTNVDGDFGGDDVKQAKAERKARREKVAA